MGNIPYFLHKELTVMKIAHLHVDNALETIIDFYKNFY